MEAVVDRTRAIKSSSFEVHIITAVDREITTSVVVALSLRLAQGRHHTAAEPGTWYPVRRKGNTPAPWTQGAF